MHITRHLVFGVASLVMGTAIAQADDSAVLELGAQVYEDTCHACHNPELSGDERVAPPIFAAVNHYSDLSERDAFVDAISSYIVAPSPQITRMPGAIHKFGLMPEQDLTEEEARAVATFLFETDFTLPDWYKEHFEEEHGEAPKED